MKSRIVFIFVSVLVLWSLLIMRAAYLQFLPNDRLNALQSRQFQTKITLQARRGAIIDRNGRDLAMSATAYSLYADPKLLENRRSVAKKLAKILNQNFDTIYSKIKDGSRRFVWIQRLLEQDKAEEIKAWDLRGISLVEEWRRVYPNETLLAQTLGFLGIEGQGLEGLELHYDPILRGNQKKVLLKRDARGRPLINNGLMFTENPEGNEVQLTVDSDLQYTLESELHEVVTSFDADHAVGIILDAKTSAILAMASSPTFDSNKAAGASASSRRNKAVTDTFEPGSTMKTLLIATALRDGVVKPSSKFFCENGSFKVGDKVIHEAEAKEKFGNLSVSEILAVSSNIGSTKIALKLGQDRLRQGLLDFGLGQKLGVDLPGEARGMVQALPWRPHLMSNISFGHGISATPLQIANAYAAIANGGELNTPFVVKSIRDSETGVLTETKVKTVRRVMTEDQANQMRSMLLGVTTLPIGSGKNARVEGYMVAGKTGTAQKVNANGGGYMSGTYISSFAGFIPANDPRFVIYVAVDSPRKGYYGAMVAAPLFAKVASYAVRKEGIAPVILGDSIKQNFKRKIGLNQQKSILNAKAPIFDSKNSSDSLAERAQVSQKITAEVSSGFANPAAPDQAVPLEVSPISGVSETPVVALPPKESVPDLMNLTTREVFRRVSGQNIKLKFVGQGVVAETLPAAGTPMPDDKTITVIRK